MAGRNTGSRIYLTMIGLLLALIGGLFTWLMWRSFSRARAVDAWPRVPCVILESGMDQRQVDPARPIESRFRVLYAYEWEGRDYQSDLFQLRGSQWSSRQGAVEALVTYYPESSVAECLVNPKNPEQAVLAGESRAPGYSIWFPIIFVVGGVGVVVGAWRP